MRRVLFDEIARLRLGVVVLATGSTKLDELRPLAPQIVTALDAVEPGQFLRIPPDA